MIKAIGNAVIYSISDVITVSEKFQKRELILDESREFNGILHPNFVCIEFTGERMALLDQFQPGQYVTVEAAVNSREYNGRYYTSLRGFKIQAYCVPQQVQTRQPQNAPQQSAPPANVFQQPVQAPPRTGEQYYGTGAPEMVEGNDELPF